MVGLIQKLLVDLVASKAGPKGVQELLRRAGIPEDRRFRLDTVYSDEEFKRLLAAACDLFEMTQDEVEVVYADWFGRDAVRRWPVWFQMSANARQLLERQQTIHNTFATGVRDPEARKGIGDKFRVEHRADEIVAHYRSPNELCGLYKALARWVLAYYEEDATVEEVHCTKLGAPECEIHIRWPKTSNLAGTG